MSTSVYIGLSGQRHALDPSVTSTVEALRTWIAERESIAPRDQILLTAQGKQVRTQTLLTENELFVFDSSRLDPNAAGSSPSSSAGLLDSSADEFHPGTPPDTIANQNDLQAWQNLFRVRKSWASGLLNGCETRARQAQRYQDEQAVIERSLSVAVASLQNHVKSADQKCETNEARAEEVLAEQEGHLGNCEANLEHLRHVPAKADFVRFLQPMGGGGSVSQQAGLETLQGFVDIEMVGKAADGARALMAGFAQEVGRIRESQTAAAKATDELLRAVDQINASSVASNSSEPAQLLEEIDMLFKKMTADLEHVQSLPRSQQSISQASKRALLHTRNYLPALSDHCAEMNELVQRTRQQRNNAADTILEHMRTLSRIESGIAAVWRESKNIKWPQDNHDQFATLSAISRLPSVYGALLVESVRRREWVAKMRRDAGTLQEEVATYQEEEDKRRKKWLRSVEDVVTAEALRSNVLGIELSLRNEGGSWPMVTRDNLQAYLDTLRKVYGPCSAADEMEQTIRDLDKPTRKQIKHARAFKNGSMHDAAFGDTSLLLRGDEQHKALREINLRLDEELKGQKSRVRKLEDLLHRQSTIGRAHSGDMFTPQSASADRNHGPPEALTPQLSGDVSRTNSLQQHRRSSTRTVEETRLAQRVVDLENELQAAKNEAASRKSSDAEVQKRVEDAVSTKKDLMENMEAQGREFATERRTLEKELAEARERVEEMENEMERLMGSRDDERTGVDSRITALEEENVRLKEDASGHAARAATEHDLKAAMERKLERAESAREAAEADMRELRQKQEEQREAEDENLQLLATAHANLSPDAQAPDGLAALSTTLEDLTRRSAAHAKDLAEAVAFAKSENESLWSSNERQKSELTAANRRHGKAEDQVRQTQERLAAEEARAQALKQQLDDEQTQLQTLRKKFADGETGSEVLRQRVTEEETKAGRLASDLAEAQSSINSLQRTLDGMQQKSQTYHEAADVNTERLEKRAERAREISQRLVAQNSRMTRLLDRLGLAVSYPDDTMVVERASKLGASTTLGDTQQMQRTVALASPSPPRKSSTEDEQVNLSILNWPEAQTAEEELARFESYLHHITRFNVDTFSDAIFKRVRDFEYTARKYSKESKESTKRADAYKDRATKLRTELQTKIAVKDFKEGDLALFLPTRGQAKGAWAAFNVGCPHFFLAERDGMRLGARDFIVARISRIEQRVVDLSKTLPPAAAAADDASSVAPSLDDDNPFDLSDGLTWWMVHAAEERGVVAGAPATPGLGKSTVAAANVDATASIRVKRGSKTGDASKHLNKSLDSRRSSSGSKKSVAAAIVPAIASSAVGTTTEGETPAAQQMRPPPLPASAATHASGLGIAADTPLTSTSTSTPTPMPAHPAAGPEPPKPDEQVANTTPSSAAVQQRPQHRQQQQRPQQLPRSRSQQPPQQPPQQQASRAASPSKSVRSLQRHLDGAEPAPAPPVARQLSPAKASAPSTATSPEKKKGWESLWQGGFVVEGSPRKGGGEGR